MAYYLVKTPKGNRLIEAKTPAAAINFALDKKDYSAESLNASELAKQFKEGLALESALEPVKAA